MEQLLLAVALMCNANGAYKVQTAQKECVAKVISCYVDETQYANTEKQKLSAMAKCLIK